MPVVLTNCKTVMMGKVGSTHTSH